MNRILKCCLVILIVFFFIWILALAKCEISSILHREEFYGLDESTTNMVEKAENVKVLKYNAGNAKIYYYDKSGACVFEFKKKNDTWEMITWNSVWSSQGNASDIVWPYWWHFIYGGF